MRQLLLLLLVCIVVCCRPKQEKPPVGVLSKEQMTHLLINKHLLESDIEFKQIPPDSGLMIFDREWKKVLDSAGIEEDRYRKSYYFYLRNPKYLDIIYATVVDSLSLREGLSEQRETLGDQPTTSPSPAPAAPPQ